MVTLNRAAYQKIERTNEWACLSTDAYTDIENFLGILNGDELTLIDTGDRYLFNADTQAWVLQPASGGGGSGDTSVESFNGRTGAVVPVATDYPPSLIGAVDKAGDTMTGDLDMGGHTVTGISDALEDTDALPKGQADDIYVNVTGDTMSGALNMGNNKITMGGTPTETTDVTNKGYVDGVVKVVSDELDGVIAGTMPITLPIASDTHLGGVIVGDGLSVDPTGTLSVDADQAPTQGSENPVQSGGVYNALQGYIPTTQKGANSGVAELDENGFVPASQLPGFVDDIVDAYVVGSTPFAADWLSLTNGGQPLTPDASKIYLVVSAGEYQYQEYRWSGTIYGQVNSGLALGETANTAFRGDQGKTAYDHSQITQGNPHGTTAEDVGARPNTWIPTAAETGAIPLPPGGADGKFLKSTGDGQVWDSPVVFIDSEAAGITWPDLSGSVVSAEAIAALQDAFDNHKPLIMSAAFGGISGTLTMTSSGGTGSSPIFTGILYFPEDAFDDLYGAMLQLDADSSKVTTIIVPINVKGDDGSTFTPSVSADGTLSWSNDGGLPNPDPVNIRGPAGTPGAQGPATVVTVGDTITGEPGTDASVTSTPTGDGIQLGFTVPRGQDGAQGPAGAPGKDNLPNVSALSGGTQSLALEDNVEYRCSDALASLTVTGFDAPEAGKAGLWSIQFTAGAGLSVVLPDTSVWAVAEPVWTEGCIYWLSWTQLVDGRYLCVWVEVPGDG